MIPHEVERELSRRGLFQAAAGLMVVSFGARAQNAAGPYPDPDFRQLDSWIAIHQDNTATFYVGKTDLGQGTGTAFRQMMCDELDIGYDQTKLIMGSTDVTVDQGGSGGSDAIQVDAWPMRRVAAEARRALLVMAAQRFERPVTALAVANGVVSVKAEPALRVTYGELVGGRKFNVALTGADVNAVTGQAKLKPVQELKLVGQSKPRYDIPPKVDGSLKWAVDVKLPGMVHARNVKPPVAGAQLVSIDESSVRGLPGFVRVLSKGNYVAVVCEREEQAIAAARKLKVEWRKPSTAAFPASEDLFTYMRQAKPTSTSERGARPVGDAAGALASAAKVVSAEYEIPFQGHTSFAPAHALADPSNGLMTIYTNDMKSYGMRLGVAKFLGMPKEKVRVVWMDGPQGFGRTAADDAGFEAAWLAQQLGRPVRVQWMREEEQAWDTKGPAFTCSLRGGLDTQGQLVAYDFDARCCDYHHVGYNEADTVLIAQLMGVHKNPPNAGNGAVPDDMYFIPNRRMGSKVVSLPLVYESPLRTGNLRDPNGPQVTFAAESFIDELAVAAGVDPVAFRLRLLTATKEDDGGFRRARSIAVVKACAEAYGWKARTYPARNGRTGRGFAYSFRSQSMVAQAVDVDVDRATGRVFVKRIVVAHDCGLVINPDGVKGAILGGTLHALSRALHEEAKFDTEKVLDRDWVNHPTLTHLDTPEKIDIVLVNGDPNPARPDLPHYGAGEAVCKPLGAAIANAIFDATGVRLRRMPFRKERVLAALNAARA